MSVNALVKECSTPERYFMEINKSRERWNRIDERLKNTYKPSKVKFIYDVEDIMENCITEEDFYKMYNILRSTVAGKLCYFYRWSP